MKKVAGHYTVVGDRFNKQGNLLMRLLFVSHKTSRFPHSPARISEVYVEALTGLDHMDSPEVLSNTLISQGSILGATFSEG